MKTWMSDTLFSRDTNLWHLSSQGKVMLNFPFFSSNHLVNCPSQAIQSTWRSSCHIAWKICHLKWSGLLILTEGRERELEDLVASQWNLPDPPIRPYSILLTPLIDSQFSIVSNSYSVSNDWYPPFCSLWKTCDPTKILPPSGHGISDD